MDFAHLQERVGWASAHHRTQRGGLKPTLRLAVGLACAFAWSTGLRAEGQFASADPSAAAVAEAPRFAAATGKPALADAFAEHLRLAGMAMLARGGLSFADRAELTDKLIMPELRAAVPGLLAQWTAIYAADLSAEDMKAIEAFYATPAGQHLLAAQPQIATSVEIASLTWQSATLRDAIAKHIDALRARGYQE